MNAYLPFDAIELWHVAGWTMIHFLWLGTLVGAVALIGRLLLRRADPSVRYAAALCSLILLAALPLAIAAWLIQNSPPLFFVPGEQVVVAERSEPVIIELSEAESSEQDALAEDSVAVPSRPVEEPTPIPVRLSSPQAFLTGRGISIALLQSCVPYLPWLWIIGTPATFALLALGIVGTRRLRRASRPLNDGPITALSQSLASSLKITRRVTIAVCDRVATPVLVGIVRPIILLPPAALTGWSPEEIEMVLLHELAHVRRWDNLINLLQRIIESLLFFHPAVWLVSNWVRREREACCDAVVVARTERPLAYAELLVALAAEVPRSVLFHPAASSAMAAGSLRARIRRILQLEDDPMLISGKSFTLMLAALLTAAALAVLYLPTIGQAEESSSDLAGTTESEQLTEPVDASAEEANGLPEAELAEEENLSADARGAEQSRLIADLEAMKRELESQLHQLQEFAILQHRIKDPQYIEMQVAQALSQDPQVAMLQQQLAFTQMQLVQAADGKDGKKAALKRKIAQFESQIAHYSERVREQVAQQAIHDRESTLNGELQKPAKETQARIEALRRQMATIEHEINELKEEVDRSHDAASAKEDQTQSSEKVGTAVESDLLWREIVELQKMKAEFEGMAAKLQADFTVERSQLHASAESRNAPNHALQQLTKEFETRRAALQENLAATEKALVEKMRVLARRMETPPYMQRVTESAEASRPSNEPPNGEFPHTVEFEAGGSQFAMGDNITVLEVRGTAKTFKPGNRYWIRGTYRLSSRDKATLSVFTTAKDAADGKGPVFAEQTIQIERGDGSFTLVLPMSYRGWPHASFYPAEGGEGFGGTYFGTDDSVLKRVAWFDQEPDERPTAASSEKLAARFPSLEEQKLADLAYRQLELELAPIDQQELQRVKALGYNGAVKVAQAVGRSASQFQPRDLLVGLHVWPTTGLQDVVDVLTRDDLAELNPLKYYVVRPVPTMPEGVLPKGQPVPFEDHLVSGRIAVNLESRRPRRAAEPANMDPYSVRTPMQLQLAEMPQRAEPNSKSALRYDGKTFDEWRKEWKTELSTEKRLEAVKALAAFGRAGYGKEAAEAILDVAGEYDFLIMSSDDEGKLKSAILAALTPDYRDHSLAQFWLPELAARLKQNPKKWQLLAAQVLRQLKADDDRLLDMLRSLAKSGPEEIRYNALGALVRNERSRDPAQLHDQTRELLINRLESGDPHTVRLTLRLFLDYGRFGGGLGGGRGALPSPQLIFEPELLPLLFDEDEQVRREARGVLRYIGKKDASQVVKHSLDVLHDGSRKADRLHAIRALAAMGSQSKEAIPALKEILMQSDDRELLLNALAAVDRIMSGRNVPVPQGVSIGDGIKEALSDDEIADIVGKLGEDGLTLSLWNKVRKRYNEVYPPENQNLGGGGGFY